MTTMISFMDASPLLLMYVWFSNKKDNKSNRNSVDENLFKLSHAWKLQKHIDFFKDMDKT
jgi:hypothetical protein